MSGTSLDGIDVAVIDIEGKRFEVVSECTFPYPNRVREAILSVSNTNAHTGEISRLNFRLAELYAKAVRNCGAALDTIELIGCHGQTIFHERRSTLQIGDGSVLAELTGKPVVSDFRTRDMAAGGRGAPLVPFVDYWLFRHPERGRVALNLGGIANITAIPPGSDTSQVIAFDTGPGNMTVDALVAHHTQGRQKFDRDGKIAAEGTVNERLLTTLLRHPYFRQKPPKTCGREQYGREFVDHLLRSELPLPDLIATATALTGASVAVGIRRFVKHEVHDVIVSGGGVHNPRMMAYLRAFIPGPELVTSTEFGISADSKEAIAFAILAYETWHRRPSNLPSATGAKRPVILGKVSY